MDKRLMVALTPLFGGLTVALVMLLSPLTATYTTDDAFQFVPQGARGQVLGVSTEVSPCPQSTPIIGIIELNGDKKIIHTSDSDITPDACFATIAEAIQEGYRH